MVEGNLTPTASRESLGRPATKESQANLIARAVLGIVQGEFLQIQDEVVDWRSLIKKVEADSVIASSADIMAEHIAGPGIYTTAENSFAKKEVDRFFEDVNLDGLLLQAGREIHLYGLHLWQKYGDPFARTLTDLQMIPLESIHRVRRDRLAAWQEMVQTPAYESAVVEARRMVIFKWGGTNQSPFGRGIAQLMFQSRSYKLSIRDTNGNTISSRNIIVPSQIDGRTMIYDSMIRAFQKFGIPYQVGILGDADMPADADEVDKFGLAMRERKEQVVNKPFRIESEKIDTRARFDAFITELNNQNILSMQTPMLKLFSAPEGLTEASARTVLRALDRQITARQRFLKRKVEMEVIRPFLRGRGLADDQITDANIRINFGPVDKPDLSFANISQFFELGILDLEETRNNLRTLGIKMNEGLPLAVPSRPASTTGERPDEQ